MKLKFASVVIVVALVVLAGAAVFLASWDIPAPSAEVVKTIPNARFQH